MATISTVERRLIGKREPARIVPGSKADLLSAATWLLGVGGLALFGGLAVLLAARRISGALTEPLPAAMLLATGSALAVAALVVRGALLDGVSLARNTLHWLRVLAPTAAFALCTWAIAVPRTSGSGLVLLATALLVEEGVSLALLLRRIRRSDNMADRATAQDFSEEDIDDGRPSELATRRSAISEPPHRGHESVGVVRADAAKNAPPAEVSQQFVRGRTADGRDECHGWLRAGFAPQQRTEVVHLAFCPPFKTTPDWTAESVEGPPLKIKHVQLLPYGVRLELRLDQASRGPVTSLVRFAAVERRERRAGEAPAEN